MTDEKAEETNDRNRPYSVDELRLVLSQAIDDIRADRSSAANVNAITNAAGKILTTLKLQIEYQQVTGKQRSIQMLEDAS